MTGFNENISPQHGTFWTVLLQVQTENLQTTAVVDSATSTGPRAHTRGPTLVSMSALAQGLVKGLGLRV